MLNPSKYKFQNATNICLFSFFFFIETPVFSAVQIGYSVQNNSEFFLLKAEASFSKKSERTGIKLGSSGKV